MPIFLQIEKSTYMSLLHYQLDIIGNSLKKMNQVCDENVYCQVPKLRSPRSLQGNITLFVKVIRLLGLIPISFNFLSITLRVVIYIIGCNTRGLSMLWAESMSGEM